MQQNYSYGEKTFISPVKKNLAEEFLVKPSLDYNDIIYDKSFNESFKRKIEMVQFETALVITCVIKGTSRYRLYQELVLESLAGGRWSNRFFFFQKITLGLLSTYLQTYHNAISEGAHQTRSTMQNKIKPIPARTKVFENSFFYAVLRNAANSTTKLEI